jgi:hypothetical protein
MQRLPTFHSSRRALRRIQCRRSWGTRPASLRSPSVHRIVSEIRGEIARSCFSLRITNICSVRQTWERQNTVQRMLTTLCRSEPTGDGTWESGLIQRRTGSNPDQEASCGKRLASNLGLDRWFAAPDVRYASTPAAAFRPSEIAQTTKD